MTLSTVDMNTLMTQMRIMASQASAGKELQTATSETSFSEALGSSINEVNSLQSHAKELSEAFDKGEDVPLTEVMLATQKASIAFQATLQIRNKVLSSYQEIMNMPV